MAWPRELEPRRIDVDDYHRMIDAGILEEDEHVELIEGVIVTVTPQKRRHAFVIQVLTERLLRLLGSDYAVLPQLPLTLADDSEPEPDIAVVRATAAASRDHHPRTADLVIEVASDSILKDRSIKGPLYARASIPEYWMFNLVDECVEVYRDPRPAESRYAIAETRQRGEELRPAHLHGIVIPVEAVLG
jgi:Uma2 family endonuclease